MKWAPLLLLMLGTFTLADDKKPAPKREPVQAILDVKFMYEERRPPALVVTARGAVPTGGWTGVQLKQKKTDKPPADGVYELQMTAVRPTGPVTQAVQEVNATLYWVNPPMDMKGLKVSGVGEGTKTVMFDEKK